LKRRIETNASYCGFNPPPTPWDLAGHDQIHSRKENDVLAQSELSRADFWEKLMPIEGKLSRGEAKGAFELFNGLDDDLFAYLIRRDFEGFPNIKRALPDWPPEDIRRDSTGGFTLHDCLKEALYFWQTVKHRFELMTDKKVEGCRVADYGAGWGRITRLCAKDVRPGSLFALEPNPVFADLFETSRVDAELIRTDWASEQRLELRDIDLVISFSIFTHTSDQLATNIVERFKEITRPGSVIALTIRPGAFLHAADGEMSHFSEPERLEALADYKRGRLVYKPYDNSPHWGVTVAPMRYISGLFEEAFTVSGPHLFFHNWTQMFVFLQRK
jgi:hypothetical protein